MLEFVDRIEQYTRGVSEMDFQSDQLLIDAVARNLELIGEAPSHVPDEIKSRYPNLPWSEMRGLRIILAHNYMGADASVLWKTAQEQLEPLRSQLLNIIHSEQQS